jgi:hypothetical protein
MRSTIDARRFRLGDAVVVALGTALIGLLYVDGWATSSVTSQDIGTYRGYDAWATFTGPALRIAIGLIVASIVLVIVRATADLPRKPFGNAYVASTAATLGLFLLTAVIGPDTSGTGTLARGVSIEIKRGLATYLSVVISGGMLAGALASVTARPASKGVAGVGRPIKSGSISPDLSGPE